MPVRDRMWLCSKKTPLTTGLREDGVRLVLERGRGMETVRRDCCSSPVSRRQGLRLTRESQGRQQEVIGFGYMLKVEPTGFKKDWIWSTRKRQESRSTFEFWSNQLERQNCYRVGTWQESSGYKLEHPVWPPIGDAERAAGGVHLDSKERTELEVSPCQLTG